MALCGTSLRSLRFKNLFSVPRAGSCELSLEAYHLFLTDVPGEVILYAFRLMKIT
jgi:hypothetical protein